MKKLCLALLAIILFSTPLFAQDKEMNPFLKDVFAAVADLKPEYDKLNNGFNATLDIPFSITRLDLNGAEIKLNLSKLSCKSCDDNTKAIFQGIANSSIKNIFDSLKKRSHHEKNKNELQGC